MNYQRVLNAILLVIIVILVVMLFRTQSADAASTANSVLAIKSVPERSHPNVSFEFDAYRVPDYEGWGDNGYLFSGGAGFTAFGQSLGAAYSYNEQTNDKDVAVATTFGLRNLKVRIGYSQDLNNLRELGTIGAGIRFGF